MTEPFLDYELPEELIAQTPLENRDEARLLHVDLKAGQVFDRSFGDVPSLFEPGDLLVLNDTRVTARRLFGSRASGGAVELLLLREHEPGLYGALTKPARRVRIGDLVNFDGLQAEVVGMGDGGLRHFRFGDPLEAQRLIVESGEVPLPPYIHHRLSDPERYQTTYAATPGSAAAPTAGLHFTPRIFEQLADRGVRTARVSLDVGLDTFRPLAGTPAEHVMHGERCRIPDETAKAISAAKGRVIAVGTTVVRTLETFATGPRQVAASEGESRLFIQPGFKFQVVDGMFTNFHLPRTTMLLMISALAGSELIRAAYSHAVNERYRFLSFGDSMLIL